MGNTSHPVAPAAIQRWNIEMCKVLGLDPAVVRSITLHISVDKPITVTVEKFVQVSQVPGLEILVKELTIKDKAK